VLQSQPFSALLGARLANISEGEVALEVPIRAELFQQDGYVHGGVLSYLADNALTFAGGTVLGPKVLTSAYKINYLRPARGRTLVARASVIHAGRRLAVCRCNVFVPVASLGKRDECRAAAGFAPDTGRTLCQRWPLLCSAAKAPRIVQRAPSKGSEETTSCSTSGRGKSISSAPTPRGWISGRYTGF
jgi:uncharacterized protein (TIGR00369 family)